MLTGAKDGYVVVGSHQHYSDDKQVGTWPEAVGIPVEDDGNMSGSVMYESSSLWMGINWALRNFCSACLHSHTQQESADTSSAT